MADAYNAKVIEVFRAVKYRYLTISGTVNKLGNPIERTILVYRSDIPDVLLGETVSDSSGDFSLSVPCGSNDLLRIICVGIDGENSEVFDSVECV